MNNLNYQFVLLSLYIPPVIYLDSYICKMNPYILLLFVLNQLDQHDDV